MLVLRSISYFFASRISLSSEEVPKFRVTSFLEFSENLEISGNLCSWGNLIVESQQNNLYYLYFICTVIHFFIRDVHGEFGLIHVHLFDILPAI